MSEIIAFPKKEGETETLLFGPFEVWRVLVEGRIIPGLTGYKHAEGTFGLTVDDRFGGTFSDEWNARQAAYLIANAMAIAQGYSFLGAPNKDKPFAPIARCIGSVEKA